MIYDETDVRKTWGVDLNNDGDDDLKLALELGLSHSWFAGGALYKALSRLDGYAGFSNWQDALAWLVSYKPEKPIAEIQYWGHGTPGRIWMKKVPLLADTPSGATPEGVLLSRLAKRLTPEALIWLRTCSTFAGVRGHNFAEKWSEAMGCRVAAYTHIIGFWQSGLHSVKPGIKAYWPVEEGIKDGTPAFPTKIKQSARSAPNTVSFLTGRFPSDW